MPNWASVEYVITGDKKQVRQLNKIIQNLEKRTSPLIPNGFGKLWLGCLVKKLGKDPETDKIYCRGEITSYNLSEGNELSLSMECAWGEMSDVRHLIEQVYPDVHIYYKVEECGMGIYVHNDMSGTHFPENYILDTSLDTEYFETIEEVFKYTANLVGKEIYPTEEALTEALESYLEEHDEEFYGLHQFEVVDE